MHAHTRAHKHTPHFFSELFASSLIVDMLPIYLLISPCVLKRKTSSYITAVQLLNFGKVTLVQSYYLLYGVLSVEGRSGPHVPLGRGVSVTLVSFAVLPHC